MIKKIVKKELVLELLLLDFQIKQNQQILV
jgi:hypothetical protein